MHWDPNLGRSNILIDQNVTFASGYSNVTNLKQDNAGNWTAKATKGGQQIAVQVDSKGMVKEAQQ